MSNHGIKISKPGYGISGNTISYNGISWDAPETLAFTSSWFAFKVILTGTISSTIASTAGTQRVDNISISHNLGYAPITMLYFSVNGTDWWPSNSETERAAGGTPLRTVQVLSTTTLLTAEIATINLPAYTLQLRYIVFADTGS